MDNTSVLEGHQDTDRWIYHSEQKNKKYKDYIEKEFSNIEVENESTDSLAKVVVSKLRQVAHSFLKTKTIKKPCNKVLPKEVLDKVKEAKVARVQWMEGLASAVTEEEFKKVKIDYSVFKQ